MFSPKRVIIAAVVVAVLSLGVMLLSMLQPETHGGLAPDTFGVRPYGVRGFYETVEAAGFQVQRGFTPPHTAVADNGGAGWLVVWKPTPTFVFREERYLNELGEWVEAGGAVFLTPEFDPRAYFEGAYGYSSMKVLEPGSDQQNGTDNDAVSQKNGTSETADEEAEGGQREKDSSASQAEQFHVLEPLRRMGVEVDRLGITDFAGRIAKERKQLKAYRERECDCDDNATEALPPEEQHEQETPQKQDPIDPNTTAAHGLAVGNGQGLDVPKHEYDWRDHRRFLRSLSLSKRAERVISRSVTPGGELGPLWQGLDTVAMADETQCLLPPEEDEPEPDGVLAIEAQNGTTMYLAAAYRKGKGLIVVVADPLLLTNALLDEPGNAYTALGPLSHAAHGDAVVFDEFFHGLSVRGRSVWLLTRRPYGLVALALVLAAALWCWRSGSRLGPPLPPVEPTRRTVEEYLQAMSGLFLRGEKQAFLAQEIKQGVLWQLSRRYRLGMGQENLEAVSKAMARRDPDGAERLEAAVHELETLAAQRKPPVKRLVAAARELTRCL